MDKLNSLQFLSFELAIFEEFGDIDGVVVRYVPFELRLRLLRWKWLRPSRDRYFFDDAGRLVITREGWEAFIHWFGLALSEKLLNDRCDRSKSASAAADHQGAGK